MLVPSVELSTTTYTQQSTKNMHIDYTTCHTAARALMLSRLDLYFFFNCIIPKDLIMLKTSKAEHLSLYKHFLEKPIFVA